MRPHNTNELIRTSPNERAFGNISGSRDFTLCGLLEKPAIFKKQAELLIVGSCAAVYGLPLEQGFPTFFAARTPLSGQSILSTPKKILRYILLYKRYISCSVTQGSSYPLMFNLVPLGVRVPPVGNPCSRNRVWDLRVCDVTSMAKAIYYKSHLHATNE